MTLAVGRLSPEQRRLVGACLDAIVHGPYIPDDDEFDAVMGYSREDTAAVATAWPEPAAQGDSYWVVRAALNNLLGYPHDQWRGLSRAIGAGKDEVRQAQTVWQ